MTADELAHVIEQQHAPTLYSYVLVDPLAPEDKGDPALLAQLREALGASALMRVPRPDLVHVPHLHPVLVCLAVPGALPSRAILELTARGAVRGLFQPRRYVCGWVFSEQPAADIAAHLSCLCRLPDNPPEVWVSRSLFGKGGEVPNVRWDSVEWADIAIAELNAETLGLQIGLNFDSVLVSDIAIRKVGGLAGLVVEQKLKFQIRLPRYDEVNSGCDWALLVHRAGDGEFPGCHSGELVASGSYDSDCPELFNQTKKFSNCSAPRFRTIGPMFL
ncbi:hypothetical protein [Pseudomonas juntendi]|uniref:Uncharacterized protein n=1 Tax=Pseudomonas juntendi TaxID=2666183 RepID=A0A7W2LU54_9PSED|nr:hypothetical protein [Pseudomonas juntendi]MBA6130592.1 hypothetical protein [Pseudomonas juntendi]MBA6147120.1 hypothetical protein [Pseudomonas juntendi]